MRKRSELPTLDDSKFKKVENRKLSFIVGGKGTPTFSWAPVGKGGSTIYAGDDTV
jgi:hypothetical protein